MIQLTLLGYVVVSLPPCFVHPHPSGSWVPDAGVPRPEKKQSTACKECIFLLWLPGSHGSCTTKVNAYWSFAVARNRSIPQWKKKKIPNPLEILPSMRTYACYMHKLPLIPIRGPLINVISSRRLQGVWLCELSREPCMLSFLVDKNRVMFITTKDNRYCKYNNFMYSQIAI